MHRVKQSSKKLMNERETIAYNWLRKTHNYNGKQIRYYSNSSPDFETLDGMLWEVKGTRPTFTYSQSIKLPWYTIILKVDKNNKIVTPILYYELPNVFAKPFNPPIKFDMSYSNYYNDLGPIAIASVLSEMTEEDRKISIKSIKTFEKDILT